MKNLSYCIVLLIFLGGMFTACEDYVHKDIEAQWQLKEMRMNGETHKVDTIFYSFKKDVFRYLRLEGESPYPPASFGRFSKNDNLLNIEIVPSESAPDYTGWTDGKKSFVIQKLSGSDLILESEDIFFVFKRY